MTKIQASSVLLVACLRHLMRSVFQKKQAGMDLISPHPNPNAMRNQESKKRQMP